MVLIAQDFRRQYIRANPHYRYVEFGHLTDDQLEALGDSVLSTEFAGVFVGSELAALSVKAAPANVAALAEQLRCPMQAGSVLPDLPPDKRDELLAGLVLDGVLEVQGEDGFVNQGGAYDCVANRHAEIVGTDALSRLSMRALEHAEQLAITNTQKLAAKLYFYHRVPASPTWAKLWPDAVAVLRYLGAGSGSPVARSLSSAYSLVSSPGSGWISWRHKTAPASDAAACRYKLYVSPQVRHLKEVLALAVELFARFPATSFKVGADAVGLLRPDKLVVYFAAPDPLFACAEALRLQLEGLPAHGVPFTTAIDEDGLLSWGVDPPPGEGRVGLYIDDSWRTWLCNRLASALNSVSRTEISVEPWRYAMTRLWFLGVDTRTWQWRESPSAPVGQHRSWP